MLFLWLYQLPTINYSLKKMIISWYGHSCFKIQTKPKRGEGDVVIFTDPFDKSIGLRPPQGQAHIVTVSHTQHDDHNNAAALRGEPFVVDAAGEYSLNGVTVQGVESFHDDKQGAERGRNTIFVLESEGIRVCHLGDLGHKLSDKQLDEIGHVDILMIPIGGTYTIGAKEAEDVIGQIEPKIIIPMHYKVKGLKLDIADEKGFIKDLGKNGGKEVLPKLVIKSKDLSSFENKLVIMSIANT